MHNDVNWDKAMEDADLHNPNNDYEDDEGYRGTGLTKAEWEANKSDDEEE